MESVYHKIAVRATEEGFAVTYCQFGTKGAFACALDGGCIVVEGRAAAGRCGRVGATFWWWRGLDRDRRERGGLRGWVVDGGRWVRGGVWTAIGAKRAKGTKGGWAVDGGRWVRGGVWTTKRTKKAKGAKGEVAFCDFRALSWLSWSKGFVLGQGGVGFGPRNVRKGRKGRSRFVIFAPFRGYRGPNAFHSGKGREGHHMLVKRGG